MKNMKHTQLSRKAETFKSPGAQIDDCGDMNKSKATIQGWWAKHKNKVYVASAILLAAGVGCFLYKNKEQLFSQAKPDIPELDSLFPLNIETVSTTADVTENRASIYLAPRLLNGGEPFPVSLHKRNLGENRFPSPEKVASAHTLGIELGEHQTWVEEYLKNQNAA